MLKKLTALAARARTHCAKPASAIVLLCACLATTAQALPFNQISQVYFFGDSLTDSGFNDTWPGLPTGKAPTFTTFGGYIWSQYIARDIKGFTLPIYPGPVPADTITNNSIYAVNKPPAADAFVSGTLTGVDYAAAGSTTNATGFEETWAPSLHQQVTYYLSTAGAKLDPNAVYFIWSGANNILTLLNQPSLPTQAQLLTAVNTAAINIGTEVAALSARGAKRIVVLSLPNIGLTPLIDALAASIPTLPATLKTVTFTFNSMLNTQLGKVIAKYGTKILYVDVYTLLDNVILATKAGQTYNVAGQSFKFVNYNRPACSTVPTAIYCPSTAPNNYIFADSIHPTGMAHRVLALTVEAEIQKWQ